MTVNRGLFVRNNGSVGTTPIEGRLALAGLVAENAPGSPRSGLLGQKDANPVTGTANMSYNVGPITAVVNRAAGEGVYVFTTSGTSNVATTAAPATGSRYDLIYVLQRDLDKGDADNTAVLAVYQGTAATTPTKPYASLPAGAYVLAEALVNSGATATNGSGVTITQVWRYTALRGGAVPVRSTAERDEITGAKGKEIIRLDKMDFHQIHDGTSWHFVGTPKRYTASNFDTSSAAGSRLIASVDNWPSFSYNIKVTLRGMLTVFCPTISSGKQEMNLAVSVAQSNVANAQGKARLSWTSGLSNVNLTATVEAQDLIVSGSSILPRIWLENVSGTLAVQPSSGVYAYFYADIMPADD